jgi:hypothetical protein
MSCRTGRTVVFAVLIVAANVSPPRIGPSGDKQWVVLIAGREKTDFPALNIACTGQTR